MKKNNPGGSMKPVLFTLFTLYSVPLLWSQVVINEVDADQTGTDAAEFIELFGPANYSLDGLVLVFFNGSDDASYNAFDLDGRSLNEEGYFVLCGNAATVENCDWDVSVATNLIQNGADAIALYQADATDFPEDTPVHSNNLIDAIVYGTNDSTDTGLVSVLTPGKPQVNESGNGSSNTHSNSRVPDGGTPFDTTLYTQKEPSPGISNISGSLSELVINEFVANHSGTDYFEFLEVAGLPDTDYAGHWIIEIEGDGLDNPGIATVAVQVGTTDSNGIWRSNYFTNTLGGGTKTYLLVTNWNESLLGEDLDSTDNGSFDTIGWDSILDDIAVSYENTGDQVYSQVVLVDEFDGKDFPPGGASRIPNGTDTNSTEDWVRNDFYGSGLPDYHGSPGHGEAANTPGFENTMSSPPRINEFVMNHTGADQYEYFEIWGDALTDYSHYWLLILEAKPQSAGLSGTILQAYQIGTTNHSRIYTHNLVDTLPNTSVSLLLVHGFSGNISDDLDTDDDGVLDVEPWHVLVDSVAIDDGEAGDLFYASTVLSAGFDGVNDHPGGASRIPHGSDTNSVSDWMRNDFDGAGIPALPGSLVPGEALNTPNSTNTQYLPGGNNVLLNEWVCNHRGIDDHEYVEIVGSPRTNYTHIWIIGLEGDLENNAGTVEFAIQAGDTDSDGYWYSGFMVEQINNNSVTLMVVDSFTGTLQQDLDTNDDGTLDITPWITLIDDVAINDGDLNDLAYSTVVLTKDFDGGIYTVGGGSRIPDAVDTDTVADWKRNDFYGKGLPGFTGTLEIGEAMNTPGYKNRDSGTGALLSEVVFHHEGGDTHEFVEIHGEAGSTYHQSHVLVIEGDSSDNPGLVSQVFTCGATNGGGFWVSDYLQNAIENGSQTILLVEEFSEAIGFDLDTDNDGTMDFEPWESISDALAFWDGDVMDQLYTPVILDNLDGSIGGASRFPYGLDTDSPSDWVFNDVEGSGLPGFSGSVTTKEAYNTPGSVTRIFIEDYYQSVQDSSPADLRASLHEVIKDHLLFAYSADFTDTWDILEEADEDPLDAGNVLSIYRNHPFAKQGGGNAFYNREHTWPKSYGFPQSYQSYPYTDCHHIMIADYSYNSARSNLPYGNCSVACEEWSTTEYNGQGGAGISNWKSGEGSSGTFEVWADRRGDVARALLYLDVRYEGGNHRFTGFSEPDLILTDDMSLVSTFSSNTEEAAYMGRLSALLEWHAEDPVDQMERDRNEVIYSYQGNRNPFIDHPEWVDCLFHGICNVPCYVELLPDWNTEPSPCNTGKTSVLDYIGVIEGTCACWP
ncbi:MAG: hypothetical protein CR997_12055 [Acidobacteria bacterium]|nr:MAG: hypothetical protein CR997_12055 [Acidobacteriota bacterium]